MSQQTIGRDLETLSIVDNVKGQGKDTRGRKRSTGRPKEGQRKSKPRQTDNVEVKIVALNEH